MYGSILPARLKRGKEEERMRFVNETPAERQRARLGGGSFANVGRDQVDRRHSQDQRTGAIALFLYVR
jgi:hypothetical protein